MKSPQRPCSRERLRERLVDRSAAPVPRPRTKLDEVLHRQRLGESTGVESPGRRASVERLECGRTRQRLFSAVGRSLVDGGHPGRPPHNRRGFAESRKVSAPTRPEASSALSRSSVVEAVAVALCDLGTSPSGDVRRQRAPWGCRPAPRRPAASPQGKARSPSACGAPSQQLLRGAQAQSSSALASRNAFPSSTPSAVAWGPCRAAQD